jgi:type I restriction enzyme S subunit
VDAVIEKTEAAIAKYKAIKSGMMRDLFTRGIDIKTGKLRPSYEDAPELYKQSELGWVPNEWEVDTLENSTDYVDYRGKTPPKSEFGIFLITARNIKEGFIDYDNSKEYIPEYAYEAAMARGKAEIGDVVITTEAPMGNVAQIDRGHLALAQRVIKYRGKSNKLINDFLAIFLMSDGFQRRLIAESTGSTVLGIKGSRLHKLFIALPEKNEQIAISRMITTQDALLTSENKNLHKHQQLKSGLMSDLLTGKVRVKYNDEEHTNEIN